jgi:hypothetical protein
MALEEFERRRSRNREDSVGRLHRSVAKRNRPAIDTVDAKLLEAPHNAHDIENRIDRTDFVQMHFIGWHPVDFTLGSRDRGERGIGPLANILGRPAPRHQPANLGDVAAMRLWRNVEVDLLTHDLAAYDFLNFNSHIAEPERLGQRAKPGRVEADCEHRTERHVSRDAAERIEDGGAHQKR